LLVKNVLLISIARARGAERNKRKEEEEEEEEKRKKTKRRKKKNNNKKKKTEKKKKRPLPLGRTTKRPGPRRCRRGP